MELEISAFDNRYTLLYKRASFYNTLARLILIRGEAEVLESYIPLRQGLEEVLERNGDLLYAYSVLLPLSVSRMEFTVTDLIMTYISLLREREEVPNLAAINQLLEKEGLAKIRSEEEYPFFLDSWLVTTKDQMAKDRRYLEYLLDTENFFSSIKPLPHSPLDFNRVTLRSYLTFLSKEPSTQEFNGISNLLELAEEIFDQSLVSVEVPLLIYTDSTGKASSKVWSSFTIRTLLPAPQPRNSFYFLVWTGTGEGGGKITKESYTIGRIDLLSAELTIDVPLREGKGEELVLSRLQEALPLHYTEIVVAKSGGDFRIYNVKLVEALFLDMLLTLQPFYTYLYMPEDSKAAFEKKKFSLHMRATPIMVRNSELPTQATLFSTIASSLNQYLSDGTPITVETPEGPKVEDFPEGSPFLIISITRADSSLDARQYIEVFSRLLTLYLEEEEGTEAYYKEVFPKVKYLIKTREVKRKVSRDTGLLQLRQAAPELFIEGYARKCQKSYQPIVVPDSQVEEWKANVFYLRGKEYHRQVMPFPPVNPKINIVCPTERYPFPGVKPNTLVRNRDIYPFIPCCFGSNQMKPGKFSTYNEYYHGLKKKEINYAKKVRILTSKILGYKRTGTLPPGLATFLNSFYTEPTDFVRVGVPRDTNSAISCILLALRGLETRTKEASIVALAKETRESFNLYPELLKQELYDLSSEEILEQLKNEEIFFDPRLFFRALEETFQVNILSFTLEGLPGREMVLFDKPRSAYYHAQPFINRPLVLLFRNYGSESDALVYPQIELIVNTKQKDSFFEAPLNEDFFRSLNIFSSTYIWEPETSFFSPELAYQDFLTPLGLIPVAQYLDGFGKLRGILSENGLTIFFPPSAPLNLPAIEERRGNDPQVVLDFLQTPPSAGYYRGEEVWGFWFSSSVFSYTYFFPLDRPYLEELPRGPANPFPLEERQAITDYSLLLEKRDLFLQLFVWFFLLTKPEWPEKETNETEEVYTRTILDWFRENFLLIGKEEKSNYTLSLLSRLFPLTTNVEEGIKFLSTFPGLVKKGRVYLYNERFARGVLYFLKGVLESYEKKDLPLPREIHGIPFKKRPFTLLFYSWEELLRWEKEVNLSAFLTVYTSLEVKFSRRTEPFFFRLKKNLFFIQNASDLATAVFISLYWDEHKIIPLVKEKVTPRGVAMNVFVIGPGGILELETASGEERAISILDYGNGDYGAMLVLI